MSNENLYALFEAHFPADRASPFLHLDGGGAVTYADLEAGSARYAAFFAGLGLVPGDRVAVQVEKSAEALLLYLGCIRAGLAYLPLNSAYQEGEVGYFLENAEPRVVRTPPVVGAALLGLDRINAAPDVRDRLRSFFAATGARPMAQP